MAITRILTQDPNQEGMEKPCIPRHVQAPMLEEDLQLEPHLAIPGDQLKLTGPSPEQIHLQVKITEHQEDQQIQL